MILSYKLFNYY